MRANHIGRGRPEAIVDGARAGTAGEDAVRPSAKLRGNARRTALTHRAVRMRGDVRPRDIVRTPADETGSRGYTMARRRPHSPIGRGSRLKIGAVSVRVRLGAQIAGRENRARIARRKKLRADGETLTRSSDRMGNSVRIESPRTRNGPSRKGFHPAERPVPLQAIACLWPFRALEDPARGPRRRGL